MEPDKKEPEIQERAIPPFRYEYLGGPRDGEIVEVIYKICQDHHRYLPAVNDGNHSARHVYVLRGDYLVHFKELPS